jgi:hypothetical protein
MRYQHSRRPGAAMPVLVLLLLAYVASSAYSDDAPPGEPVRPKSRTSATISGMEARLTDGSVLKLAMLDSHIRLKTAYGQLRIPTSEIRRIDFATRLGDEQTRAIDQAVAELGHEDYEVRERASEKLGGFGAAAYPALVKAAEADDLEVVHRAEKLLASIRESLPAEQFEVRTDDVVHTGKSKIAGQLDAASLLVETEPFGKQELKLTSLRSLRQTGAGDWEIKAALPDPGTLSNYQGQVGKQFQFRVTGGAMVQFGGGFVGSTVWGSDIYSLDSSLAMAAVHAGLLKNSETGIVTVAILGPQNSFAGSTRNGVTSSSWGPFPGAFKFVRDGVD